MFFGCGGREEHSLVVGRGRGIFWLLGREEHSLVVGGGRGIPMYPKIVHLQSEKAFGYRIDFCSYTAYYWLFITQQVNVYWFI